MRNGKTLSFSYQPIEMCHVQAFLFLRATNNVKEPSIVCLLTASDVVQRNCSDDNIFGEMRAQVDWSRDGIVEFEQVLEETAYKLELRVNVRELMQQGGYGWTIDGTTLKRSSSWTATHIVCK
jgi:hypothetical protein